MVPPSKKRKLPSVAAPAAKRSKNSAKGAAAKTNPTAGGKAKAKAKAKPARHLVEATSLAWQSVGEEFGGLEVIEGVDVVRNGGTVQFLVAEQQRQQQQKQKPDCSDSTRRQGAAEAQDAVGEPAQGPGDGAVEGEDVHPGQAGDSQGGVESKGSQKKAARKDGAGEQKKKAGGKLAPAAKELQKPASHKQQGNSFDALVAVDDAAQEEADMGAWVELNLSTRTVSAIAKLGFAKPTLIQQKTIPEILAGDDVIGKAQTGSGKTLAFGIPVVEKWLELYVDKTNVRREGPTAVVLSPTRELAKQISDHIKALCDGLPTAPYVCTVTGGLSIQKQQRQLEKADIVIATPGRLWEVLDGDMSLQDSFTKIKFLVVDEADRLFKAGQFKEAQDIIGALDRRDPEADDQDDDQLPPRQTLVFSATFDKNLQSKLAGRGKASKTGSDEEKMEYLIKCLKFRGEPKFIDVNPVSQMADGLKEGLIECGAMEKDLYLYSVLVLNPGRRTLVFTNSISAVRRLTPLLQNLGLSALPLHSQMIQKARLRSIERFAAASNSILVATDVAARGLDIKEVDQVLHYHVPRQADTYIHRSGRTARGHRSGISVILCSPEEVLPTRRLASKVHSEREGGGGVKREHFIETLAIDRKIAARLKSRVDLAKRIADAVLAKEKGHSEDTWLRNAAEELGVDYDSEEFDGTAPGNWGGRGGGRKKKEKEARQLSKAEMGALRAQLREQLSRRVNLGVSEKYITGGRVDVGALLREREKGSVGGLFLGGDGLVGLNI
ncbi:P-loop containing nucleoside triphosphate hydrolase protein [Trichoderma compactum]